MIIDKEAIMEEIKKDLDKIGSYDGICSDGEYIQVCPICGSLIPAVEYYACSDRLTCENTYSERESRARYLNTHHNMDMIPAFNQADEEYNNTKEIHNKQIIADNIKAKAWNNAHPDADCQAGIIPLI